MNIWQEQRQTLRNSVGLAEQNQWNLINYFWQVPCRQIFKFMWGRHIWYVSLKGFPPWCNTNAIVLQQILAAVTFKVCCTLVSTQLVKWHVRWEKFSIEISAIIQREREKIGKGLYKLVQKVMKWTLINISLFPNIHIWNKHNGSLYLSPQLDYASVTKKKSFLCVLKLLILCKCFNKI